MQINIKLILLVVFSACLVASCKKIIEVGEPVNSITTTETFSTDAQANSALAGIYTNMIGNNDGSKSTLVFSNGGSTIWAGLSSDELIDYAGTIDPTGYEFNTNDIKPTNSAILNSIWAPAYFNIYGANAAIAGLANSREIHDNIRNELTGEAKFIRAFCYFYLTNLFGNVPLVLTTDFNKTILMKRAPVEQLYAQIVRDLKEAQDLLATDYSVGLGERIRPNKWAATALLARVYLYMGKWSDAELEATNVINNNQYHLEPNLTNVFAKNSTETIWQLQQNNTGFNKNATCEGVSFIPGYLTSNYPLSFINGNPSYFIPSYLLSSQLLSSFETGDQRKLTWVNSATVLGTTYFYPYKYTLGSSSSMIGGNIPQYYMILRLAEQYLIRAEAKAQLGNDLAGAAADLNIIRVRAGLNNTSASNKPDILTAVYHEKQIEFFAEWGHRWLDLKRWGSATQILSTNKGYTVNNNSLLYPIPLSEITINPNLTQNSGY